MYPALTTHSPRICPAFLFVSSAPVPEGTSFLCMSERCSQQAPGAPNLPLDEEVLHSQLAQVWQNDVGHCGKIAQQIATKINFYLLCFALGIPACGVGKLPNWGILRLSEGRFRMSAPLLLLVLCWIVRPRMRDVLGVKLGSGQSENDVIKYENYPIPKGVLW